ncbi:unnamed protein product [Penicillium salamii]|nr:unnamed protein product [Penicillium salamii]
MFHKGYNELIILKDINVFSLCKYYIVPFTGKIQVFYVVAVVIEYSHFCIVIYNIQKISSTTTISCMVGCMQSSVNFREEFLAFLN